MLQNPKGTKDIFSTTWYQQQLIIDQFIQLCKQMNYQPIQTPIFEYSSLFQKVNNANTDTDTAKEMYIFNDSKYKYALRPENTASVVRAYLQNKLYANNENKFFYIGRMFRHDNPQRGRYREFTQLGVELFDEATAASDTEIIMLAHQLLQRLNISTELHINTIGCEKCRGNYITTLQEYLKDKELCNDCKKRLDNNPLRILDCKVCTFENVPSIYNYICDECKGHFNTVQKLLAAINVPYTINNHLVRGLDYYSNTVFEFVFQHPNLQLPITLIGGGRYNGLIKQFCDGIDQPAIGFAAGLERLLLALELTNQLPEIRAEDFIYIVSQNEKEHAFKLYNTLIANGINAQINFHYSSLTKQLRTAAKSNAKYVFIIEEDEVKNNYITIKELTTSKQQQISYLQLFSLLQK